MESLKIKVHCDIHPKELIHRVNLNPTPVKDLLCIECLLESAEDKSNIKLLEDLIKDAEKSVEHKNVKVENLSEVKEVLTQREYQLSALKEHVTEKKKIYDLWIEKTRESLNLYLDNEKKRFHKLLDNEVNSMSNNFDLLEKELKLLENPSSNNHEALVEKAKKLSNYTELQTFVKELKNLISTTQNHTTDEKTYLNELKDILSVKVENFPDVEVIHADYESFYKNIEQEISRTLARTFEIKNSIKDISETSDIVFDSETPYYLRSIQKNEHLYIAQFGEDFHGKYAFTWTTSQLIGDAQAKLHLKPAKGKNCFYIFTPYDSGYYYASEARTEVSEEGEGQKMLFNKQYTDDECVWIAEKYHSGYKFRSAKYGGYLYASNSTKDSERRWVYVSKPGENMEGKEVWAVDS